MIRDIVERLPQSSIAASLPAVVLLFGGQSALSYTVGVLGKNSRGHEKLVWHELSFNYNLKDISPEATAYLEENIATRYKHWKCELHMHFKKWDDSEIARLEGCPMELLERSKDWDLLYKHFTDTKFVKKSVVGKKARESKILLHHFNSMPFSYRVEARRQEGSMFLELDKFKDVYVRPGDETIEQHHATMVENSLFNKRHRSFPLMPQSRTSLYLRTRV